MTFNIDGRHTKNCETNVKAKTTVNKYESCIDTRIKSNTKCISIIKNSFMNGVLLSYTNHFSVSDTTSKFLCLLLAS